MVKYLGKRRMYSIALEQIKDHKMISGFSRSFYEKQDGYEWLTVYGKGKVYKLCAGHFGAYLSFSVYDKDFNRVSREMINGYMIKEFNNAV